MHKVSNGPTVYRCCDEPMARSKGLIGERRMNLPRCWMDCENCIACMEVDIDGNRQHVNIKNGAAK